MIYAKWPRLQGRSDCGGKMLSFIDVAFLFMLKAGTLQNRENNGH